MAATSQPAPLSVIAAESTPPLVLAIDIGTSSVRTLLYDSQGAALEGTVAQEQYELTTAADGTAVSDPMAITVLLDTCIDATIDLAGRFADHIEAVGFTTHWHNLMGCDSSGNPTTPVLHLADNRSVEQVDRLRADLDQGALRQQTGCMFHSSYWPAKLLWLRQSQADMFAATHHWTSIGDFVMRQWFGSDAMSYCMASGTGLLDLQSGTWNELLLDYLGVPLAAMPGLVDRDLPGMGLRPDQASRWPQLAKAPWFPPLGDGACANVGIGGTDPSRMAMTLGTTGAVRIVEPGPFESTPIPPPDLWIYRLDRAHVVTGAAISNGGLVLSWLCELLGIDEGEAESMAVQVPAGAESLLMLPFLTGERSPLWDDRLRGTFDGISVHHGPAHFLRAGMESVALRLAVIYDSLAPRLPDDHRVVASGAALLRSQLWLQMCANALGRPIVDLPEDLEASARGAALLALRPVDGSGPAAIDPAAGRSSVDPRTEETMLYASLKQQQQQLSNLHCSQEAESTDNLN